LTPPLSHHGWGRVTDVAFSPAGDRVVTASADGTAQVWQLGGNDWPADDLERLAEALGGSRIGAGAGGLVPPGAGAPGRAWGAGAALGRVARPASRIRRAESVRDDFCRFGVRRFHGPVGGANQDLNGARRMTRMGRRLQEVQIVGYLVRLLRAGHRISSRLAGRAPVLSLIGVAEPASNCLPTGSYRNLPDLKWAASSSSTWGRNSTFPPQTFSR